MPRLRFLLTLSLLAAVANATEPSAAPPPPSTPATPSAPAAPAAPAVPNIGHAELAAKLQHDELLLLDVRTPSEYAAGHIPRAINIPHDQLANNMTTLPANKDRPIAVYCRSGRRSALALEWLRTQGYNRLLHVEGDFLGWQAAGQPIDAPSSKP